jgi:hypothetical protein
MKGLRPKTPRRILGVADDAGMREIYAAYVRLISRQQPNGCARKIERYTKAFDELLCRNGA